MSCKFDFIFTVYWRVVNFSKNNLRGFQLQQDLTELFFNNVWRWHWLNVRYYYSAPKTDKGFIWLFATLKKEGLLQNVKNDFFTKAKKLDVISSFCYVELTLTSQMSRTVWYKNYVWKENVFLFLSWILFIIVHICPKMYFSSFLIWKYVHGYCMGLKYGV